MTGKTLFKTLRNNKRIVLGVCGVLFYVAFIVGLFIPTGSKMYGSFSYSHEGIVMEQIVLHIDNSAHYYRNVDGKLVEYNNGAIRKWKAVLNKKEDQEYKENGLISSVVQIQLNNESGQSFFQLFKINNYTMYSKVEIGGADYQKCFVKN